MLDLVSSSKATLVSSRTERTNRSDPENVSLGAPVSNGGTIGRQTCPILISCDVINQASLSQMKFCPRRSSLFRFVLRLGLVPSCRLVSSLQTRRIHPITQGGRASRSARRVATRSPVPTSAIVAAIIGATRSLQVCLATIRAPSRGAVAPKPSVRRRPRLPRGRVRRAPH